MAKNYTLEIATFTLQGAIEATQAGAHRIELCDNAPEGGTTPSYGMLQLAPKLISIPLFPIVRPRGGHFVYTNHELDSMRQDILLCKQLNYPGVVLGFLNHDGTIPTALLNEFVALSSPMQVTFHRAFDRCANMQTALEQIIDSGCTRILTSGQYPSVWDGKENILLLIQQADNRIIIMPGSGLNSENVSAIARHTGATEFHTAARKNIHDHTLYSPETMNEKMNYTSVNSLEIKKILEEMERWN